MKINFFTICILSFLGTIVSAIALNAQSIHIISQPQSENICENGDLRLSVNAIQNDNQPLTYQWFKDNSQIAGANRPVLNYFSINFQESGLYFCRVYLPDGSDSLDSRSAAVYVLTKTRITKQPEDIRLSGSDDLKSVALSFEAHVDALPNELNDYNKFEIYWFKKSGNQNIPLLDDDVYRGTKSNKLTINLLNITDTSHYFAIIKGKCGSDTTRTAALIKNSNDLIRVNNPGDIDTCYGSTITLQAGIESTQKGLKINYRWYKNGIPLNITVSINGVFTPNLQFKSIKNSDEGYYKLLAEIKELNYKSFSKEAFIKVRNQPEFICFRKDSNFSSPLFGNSVFYYYKSSEMPTVFRLYRNGVLFGEYTKYSNQFTEGDPINLFHNLFHVKDVYCGGFYYSLTDTTSEYQISITNRCGTVYSDKFKNKDNFDNYAECDPFNQFNVRCESESVKLHVQCDLESSPRYRYRWIHFARDEYYDKTKFGDTLRDNDRIHGAATNSLTIDNIKIEDNGDYIFHAYTFWNENDTHDTIYPYGPFHLEVQQTPKILKQPANLTLSEGEIQNIFSMNIEYNPDTTIAELYYIGSIGDKPRLIFRGRTDYYSFKYNKTIEIKDAGFYYCIITNSACGSVISDTINIKVLPKGIVSGLSDGKTNQEKSGILSHTLPFPAPAANSVSSIIYWNGTNKFSDLDCSVYNIYGNKLENSMIHLEFIENKQALLSWDCSTENAGIYFIVVKCGGENLNIPIVVAR